MSNIEIACWDFCFIDDINKNLIVHAFDMQESLRLANRNDRLQAYKSHLCNSWYIINWDNVSFVSERICSDDPSCPLLLQRLHKIREEEDRLRSAAEDNKRKLVVVLKG